MWLVRESSDGKTWIQVGQKVVNNSIPPAPPKTLKVEVEVQCVEGQWKIAAYVEGRGPSGDQIGVDKRFTHELTDDDRRVAVIKKCPLGT